MAEEIRRVLSEGDYYKILGVARDVDERGLKKAYKRLALLLHPDKCSEEGADDAFKKVSSAYSCLSCANTRRTYDLTGSDKTCDVSDTGDMGFAGRDDIDEILKDIFSHHSGGASHGNFPRGGFVYTTSFGGANPFGMGGEQRTLPRWLHSFNSLPLPVILSLIFLLFSLFVYYVCAFIVRQFICLMILVIGPSKLFPPRGRLILFLALVLYDICYKKSILSMFFN